MFLTIISKGMWAGETSDIGDDFNDDEDEDLESQMADQTVSNSSPVKKEPCYAPVRPPNQIKYQNSLKLPTIRTSSSIPLVLFYHFTLRAVRTVLNGCKLCK